MFIREIAVNRRIRPWIRLCLLQAQLIKTFWVLPIALKLRTHLRTMLHLPPPHILRIVFPCVKLRSPCGIWSLCKMLIRPSLRKMPKVHANMHNSKVCKHFWNIKDRSRTSRRGSYRVRDALMGNTYSNLLKQLVICKEIWSKREESRRLRFPERTWESPLRCGRPCSRASRMRERRGDKKTSRSLQTMRDKCSKTLWRSVSIRSKCIKIWLR